MRTEGSRSGQAAAEAAVAMALFVLVTYLLFAMAQAVIRGLSMQGEVRAEAGEAALATDADSCVEKIRSETADLKVGERETLRLETHVAMPGMVISGGSAAP